MKTDVFVIILVLAIGIAAGYGIFYSLQQLPEQTTEDNFTYEQKSFVSQEIARYNITINTQLPQIVKNPMWKTPVKIYIDEKEAKRRRLADRPVEGLRKAMNTLENVTEGRVRFIEVSNANDADVVANFTFNFSSDEAVGEGGPTLFLRTGEFTLIKKGELHLLPVEYECTSYTLAVHEIGHVLGFGHSKVYNSVMWPKFGCLTNNLSEIIHDVKEIYQHYKPDIEITNARASIWGNSVNIAADIANTGPKDSEGVELVIYFNGKEAHKEKIALIEVGYSLQFKATLPAVEQVSEIKLEVIYSGDELTKENNVAVLKQIGIKE